ncbi:hypothetical protein [Natronorarus salvus]|uniref:hypothetical protein n=1 Tax=Natronorarus salvus TaxID=3117733 RepID=UPI002F262E24
MNPAIENRTSLGGVGLALTIGALGLAAGPTGAIVGLTLIPIWLFFPIVFTVAAAHVLLATLHTATVIDLLFVELGVLFVIAGRASTFEWTGTLLSTTTFTAAVGFLLVAVVLSVDLSLWIATGVLLITFGVASYGLHRYELVSLGLVTES